MKKLPLLVLLIFTIGCQNDEPINPQKGFIQFSFSGNSGGRVGETATPAAVLLSLEDGDGNVIELDKKLPLYSFGSGYVSESLQLSVGNYMLTKFMVLDAANKVIYATPIEGSELAYLVDDPLPIAFAVTENESTLVIPQVLDITDNNTPENFGYVSFGFEIVDTKWPKLKEVIINEGFGSISKTLYYYSSNRLVKAESYYCYGDCTLSGYSQYYYGADGRVLEILQFNVLDGANQVNPISTKFEFQNGLLKKKWYTGDVNSNNWEYEYYYNNNGLPTHAIQKMQMSGEYKAFRYWEYELNSQNEVSTVSVYSMTLNGEKNVISFKYDYEYSEGLNPFPFSFGEFTPQSKHVITSNKLTEYTNNGGVVSEHSNCLFTRSFEYNPFGFPTQELVMNPDGCTTGEFDKTVKQYVYY